MSYRVFWAVFIFCTLRDMFFVSYFNVELYVPYYIISVAGLYFMVMGIGVFAKDFNVWRKEMKKIRELEVAGKKE